jgi:hypothetical protein
MMDDRGESDSPIVPEKLSNNAGASAAEGVEGRGLVERNAATHSTARTQSRK